MDYYYYLIFFIPVFIFTLFAQASVNSTFTKFSKIANRRGLTGAEAARRILQANGVHDVRIEPIAGSLTDHFDPRENVIRLSEPVHSVASIAAVGVAAHEAGHAVQYAVGYSPIKLRSAIVGVTQFSSKWSIAILLLGFLIQSPTVAMVGFWLYAVVAFFQLVTVPVEFNASRRALAALAEGYALDEEELKGAKKVLSAAAMTYVAALASSLVQLLRLWLMISGSRSRRD